MCRAYNWMVSGSLFFAVFVCFLLLILVVEQSVGCGNVDMSILL